MHFRLIRYLNEYLRVPLTFNVNGPFIEIRMRFKWKIFRCVFLRSWYHLRIWRLFGRLGSLFGISIVLRGGWGRLHRWRLFWYLWRISLRWWREWCLRREWGFQRVVFLYWCWTWLLLLLVVGHRYRFKMIGRDRIMLIIWIHRCCFTSQVLHRLCFIVMAHCGHWILRHHYQITTNYHLPMTFKLQIFK